MGIGPDYDHPDAFRWEAAYAASHRELSARLYVYFGEFELIPWQPAWRYWSLLESRHYSGLELTEFVKVPGENHGSVYLGSLGHALRTLYARRDVPVPLATLRRYVGEWQSDSGMVATIRLGRDGLLVDVPKFRMSAVDFVAESDTSFVAPARGNDAALVFSRAAPAQSVEPGLILRVAATFSILRRTRAARLATADLPTCDDDLSCTTGLSSHRFADRCGLSSRRALPSAALSADAAYTVKPDGKGVYALGVDHTMAMINTFANLTTNRLDLARATRPKSERAIRIDLRRPVPGGGGAPMGIVVDSNAEIHVMWKDVGAVLHSFHDIPIGTTTLSDGADLSFHSGGAFYQLRAGPEADTTCQSGSKSVIHARGSTKVSITRAAEGTWIVTAPPGSIARLWDVSHTDRYAVDKGLYYFSYRIEFTHKP